MTIVIITYRSFKQFQIQTTHDLVHKNSHNPPWKVIWLWKGLHLSELPSVIDLPRKVVSRYCSKFYYTEFENGQDSYIFYWYCKLECFLWHVSFAATFDKTTTYIDILKWNSSELCQITIKNLTRNSRLKNAPGCESSHTIQNRFASAEIKSLKEVGNVPKNGQITRWSIPESHGSWWWWCWHCWCQTTELSP